MDEALIVGGNEGERAAYGSCLQRSPLSRDGGAAEAIELRRQRRPRLTPRGGRSARGGWSHTRQREETIDRLRRDTSGLRSLRSPVESLPSRAFGGDQDGELGQLDLASDPKDPGPRYSVDSDESPSDSLPAWAWRSHPEVPLMFAVLHRAVRDVLRGPARNPRLFLDARDWILADDVLWPFSFLRICDALDLEPDRLRSHPAVSLSNTLPPKRARRHQFLTIGTTQAAEEQVDDEKPIEAVRIIPLPRPRRLG